MVGPALSATESRQAPGFRRAASTTATTSVRRRGVTPSVQRRERCCFAGRGGFEVDSMPTKALVELPPAASSISSTVERLQGRVATSQINAQPIRSGDILPELTEILPSRSWWRDIRRDRPRCPARLTVAPRRRACFTDLHRPRSLGPAFCRMGTDASYQADDRPLPARKGSGRSSECASGDPCVAPENTKPRRISAMMVHPRALPESVPRLRVGRCRR